MRRLPPAAVLALVALGWGTIPATVAPVHLPAVAVTASRCWLATIALGVIVAIRRRRTPIAPMAAADRRRVGLLAVAAGAVIAAHWTLQFAAYDHAPASTVAFVIYLAPVGVAVLAPHLLREPTPRRTYAALAVAVVGAALLTGATLHAGAQGVVLAGGSAIGLVALTLLAKPLSVRIGGLEAALAELGVASVLLALPMLRMLTGGDGPAHPAWALLLILGLVHTAAFISIQLWCLARLPAATAMVIGQLEPVGVVLVGLLQDHVPAALSLGGGALIVGAGLLVAASHALPAAPVADSPIPLTPEAAAT